MVPKDSSATGDAKLGAIAEIEQRDAAPKSMADTFSAPGTTALPEDSHTPAGTKQAASDSASSKTEAPGDAGQASTATALTGRQHGAAGLLEGAGSGLSAFWDKHWSHTEITRPPDAKEAGKASEKKRRSCDEPSVVASASDAGHLSVMSQPMPPTAKSDVRVRLHISVSEDASEGISDEQQPNRGPVYVIIEVMPPNAEVRSEAEGASVTELMQAKAAGFAPVARLASLGGFMRSQPWRAAAHSSQLASQGDPSGPQLPVKEDVITGPAAQPKDCSAPAESQSSSKKVLARESNVRVEIRLQEQHGSDIEDNCDPCVLVLSVPSIDEQSHAAGDGTSAQPSSRLHSLSGLFRASKPSHAPPAAQASKPKESSSEDSTWATKPTLKTAEHQTLVVPPSSAPIGQHRARWAVPGSAAVSSLYGLVQHAAEVPLAHAGRAVGSLPGMRSRAGVPPDSSDKGADADMTADIVMRIKTAASAILEVCAIRHSLRDS